MVRSAAGGMMRGLLVGFDPTAATLAFTRLNIHRT